MRMSEVSYEGQPPIDGYGPGGFRVAGQWFDGAVLVRASGVTALGTPSDGIALLGEGGARTVDVVLIGQGAEIAPLDQDWRLALEQLGIGIEHMATPTACRTYNVLLGEGRRVAALLIPV